MSTETEPVRGWWGEYRLETGQAGRWRIGCLELWIEHQRREWRIASLCHEGDDGREPEWEVDLEAAMPARPPGLERFVFSRETTGLRLRPALADRPVVSSPRIPVYLLPGESADLYAGSPLWIRIELGEPPRTAREIPIRRPSDTWFGRPTGAGELCYASRTHAALEVANLPSLVRRAVTPVAIRNRAESPLKVERLKLPVPLVSLYQAPSGLLWTQSVTLAREDESEMANLDVHEGPPAPAGRAVLVSEAREEPEPGKLIRAFSALF